MASSSSNTFPTAFRVPPHHGMFRASVLVMFLVLGCGGDRSQPDPASTRPLPQPTEQAAPRTSAAPAAQISPAVDLLHAVPSTVVVSSAYRDDDERVGGLVDGDLESAWNSRTGDLVGAFVEMQIPVEASVTEIQLTAGFTRQRGDRDLFTSNHRIAEVQVTRNGERLGTFPLNTDERGLQSLRVSGQGGVYRITVTRTVEGSRPDWREVCVSELRVMGHAPSTGQHTPTIRLAESLDEPSPPTSVAASASGACDESDPSDGTCVVLPLGRPIPSGGRVDIIEVTDNELGSTEARLVIGSGDDAVVEALGSRSDLAGATEDYRISGLEVTASEISVRWTHSYQEFPCTGDGADDGSPECHPPAERTTHRVRCRLEGAGTEVAGWECQRD